MGLDDAVILMYPACRMQAYGDQGQSSVDSALASPPKHQAGQGPPGMTTLCPRARDTTHSLHVCSPDVMCGDARLVVVVFAEHL